MSTAKTNVDGMHTTTVYLKNRSQIIQFFAAMENPAELILRFCEEDTRVEMKITAAEAKALAKSFDFFSDLLTYKKR